MAMSDGVTYVGTVRKSWDGLAADEFDSVEIIYLLCMHLEIHFQRAVLTMHGHRYYSTEKTKVVDFDDPNDSSAKHIEVKRRGHVLAMHSLRYEPHLICLATLDSIELPLE